MDIGHIRYILEQEADRASKEPQKRHIFKTRYDRAIEQVRNDIQTLDEIMARNFGMAYNPDLKIYE